jgi:cytochrome P450
MEVCMLSWDYRIARELVAKRFGPNKLVKKDMLGSFINHGLSQTEAESESLLQIFAGSDTTATALRSTMLHLLSTPTAYAKLKAEIWHADDKEVISSPVAYAECLRLPYLQACVKEGLRIVPPVPTLMPRVVPPEGDMINSIFVPGGVNINHCSWGVQRRKDIYGNDADCFRPERWIEADEEQRRLMDNTLEFIFGGSGRWSCLGRTIALVELHKAFVELLRRFDFAIYNPTKPWKEKYYGLFLQTELFVRITRAED